MAEQQRANSKAGPGPSPESGMDRNALLHVLKRRNVDQNLTFLVHEVRKQVERAERMLAERSDLYAAKISERDDHVDNLKRIIQGKCYELAGHADLVGTHTIEYLRSVAIVAINLERIGDFCVDIATQVTYLTNRASIADWDFAPMFNQVLDGLSLVEPAITGLDLDAATRICRYEHELDALYADRHMALVSRLRDSREPEDLMTITFIYRFLERMGDALQNIGEAVLSALMGEPVKLAQFHLLESSLETIEVDPHDGVEMTRVGETRSGCRIDRVVARTGELSRRPLVFKEGPIIKIRKEQEGMERWRALRPNLVPFLVSFHESGDRGALLTEWAKGRTIEDLIRRGPDDEFRSGIEELTRQLGAVYAETRLDRPSQPRFMSQLNKRLGDVYALHPELQFEAGTPPLWPALGQLHAFSDRLDEVMLAPVSVLTHGDCNVDNFMFEPTSGSLRVLDLHRTAHGDYVQDISVFMVSNHRMEHRDEDSARRSKAAAVQFLEFGRKLAQDFEDELFEARLALGLARSWVTSTRFIIERGRADSLFHRAVELLEHLIQTPDPELKNFRLTEEMVRG